MTNDTCNTTCNDDKNNMFKNIFQSNIYFFNLAYYLLILTYPTQLILQTSKKYKDIQIIIFI